jgi:hypothetical protein
MCVGLRWQPSTEATNTVRAAARALSDRTHARSLYSEERRPTLSPHSGRL